MRNITRSVRYLPAALAACCLLAATACDSPTTSRRQEAPRDDNPDKPGQTGMIVVPASPVFFA